MKKTFKKIGVAFVVGFGFTFAVYLSFGVFLIMKGVGDLKILFTFKSILAGASLSALISVVFTVFYCSVLLIVKMFGLILPKQNKKK